MRETILIVCCTCVLLSGCSPESTAEPGSISTSSDKTKISFGVYDIANGGPNFSSLFARNEPLQQRNISSVQTTSGQSAEQPQSDVVDRVSARSTRIADDKQAGDRRVIKNAEMHLESREPDVTQKVIIAIAEANSGFVLSTDQSMSDITQNVRDSVSITIRVPAGRFNTAVDAIRESADRFLVESQKGEDVTEEFVDIEARLRAKKALEEQFIEIMKQSGTVEEALLVQSRLADVRTEIEKIEGRMRFLQNQSEMSTIKVSIQTPTSIAAQSAGFFGRLSDSAIRGGNSAVNFTLGLVTFLIGAMPFALFIGLPIFLIGRSVWSKKTNTMSITEIAQDEIKTE